jgi:hypothetical protein
MGFLRHRYADHKKMEKLHTGSPEGILGRRSDPVVSASRSSSLWKRCAPALTLVLAAPLLTEVLPGATRFSSLFVLPIEMCVWGGGALMIRCAVRRWRLGWLNLLLLGLALALAEECLIQQTSLAPMVVHLKGEVYARAAGVNYVYLLWALAYETVFVVFLPVYLVEMIFPNRRDGLWVSKGGLAVVGSFFLLGSFLAWFTWTQIARIKVFHLPPYNPPMSAVLVAFTAICSLVFLALGPFRGRLAGGDKPLKPPAPLVIGIAGALWASLWFGLVLLAFGIDPGFPPSVAVASGLLLTVCVLFAVPRWTSDPRWSPRHVYSVVFGTMVGSMTITFVGFVGAARGDLYFKIASNILAFALMAALGFKVRTRPKNNLNDTGDSGMAEVDPNSEASK